ncbi:MAG: TonB-dependent receptor [Muribaculaceae bacterium]|nr:TonB-dependent receptor [Muribaculaceae bacterium]
MKKKCALLTAFFLACCTPVYSGFTVVGQTTNQSQTGRISGLVTDSKGEPLIGASVMVKGTKHGTTTDIDGKYILKANPEDVVVVSYVGQKTKEFKVGTSRNVNVNLESNTETLDEIVVVGFGSQKKVNVTGAVTSVDVDKAFSGKPILEVSKGLQGVVPGLTITSSSNDQGAAPTIKIRGNGSINGNNKPLILLDGVEIEDLSFVNPNSVANISVLKDAASSSIYGSRAAYGVVLITSKDGSDLKNKVRVSYSNNFSWNEAIALPKYCTGYDAVEQLKEGIIAQKNTDGTDIEAFGMYYKDLIGPMTQWLDKYNGQDLGLTMVYGRDYIYDGKGVAQFYRVWDPNKELFKSTSFQHSHDLSIAGNSGKTNYNISLGYNKQDGVMKQAKSQYTQRITSNLSVNTQVFKWLNVGAKVMYTEKEQEYPFGYSASSSSGGLYYYNMRFPTFFPYGISDGGHDEGISAANAAKAESGKGYWFRHGNGYVVNAPTCTVKDQYLRLGANLRAELTKGLTVYADYTRGQYNYLLKTLAQPQYVANWWGAYSPLAAYNTNDYLENTWVKKTSNTFDAYVDYIFDLDKVHNFAVKVGMNAEDLTYNSNSIKSLTLLNPNIPTLNQTAGKKEATAGESLASRSTAGFFGRINYDYKGIYLVELNGRYDGSSQFRPSKKWAFFPSASIGYRISEENYFETAKQYVNNLKFRASYGSIGNQDVSSTSLAWYTYTPTIETSNSSWVDASGNLASSNNMPTLAGSEMTWEKIRTLDIGLNMGFFSNRLTVDFDWYQRKNDGMLVPRNAVPAVGGFPSLPKENSGDLKTTGWELEIGYNHLFNNGVSLYGSFAISDSKSKITSWNTSTNMLTGNYEGKELGEIWGFETADGYFTADEVANGVMTSKGLVSIADYQGNYLKKGSFIYGEGDVKYKDLNGDGTVNTGDGTLENHGDLKRIGNFLPRYEYSFRVGAAYKGFDAEILFQGVGKRDFWTISSLFLPHTAGAQMNIFSNQLDYYTSENTDAKFPRPYINGSGSTVNGFSTYTGNNNFYPQSKYLANLSYLRIKNLTVGYTLPTDLTRKAFIEKARFYFSVENLVTFDNIDGVMDPELTGGWSTTSSENGDTSYAGRATPYTRSWSCGVQITF